MYAVIEADRRVNLIPFCPCMHQPDYAGGKPGGQEELSWRAEEYDVLSTEEVYATVAEHRAVCTLQPDLFADEVRL